MLTRKLGIGAAVIGLMMFVPLAARGADMSEAGKKWINKAKHESMAQIDLASLAVNQGSLHELKDVAEHVVSDHRIMDKDLQGMVERYDVTLVDEPTIAADKEHAKLAGLSGHDFDVEFVNEELSRHERMLDFYKHAAEDAPDEVVKAYASRYVETIRKHLEKFKDLKAKVG